MEKTPEIIVPVVALERRLQIYSIEDVSAINDLRNRAEDSFGSGWKVSLNTSRLFFSYSELEKAGFDVYVNKDTLTMHDVDVKFAPKIIDKSKPALAQMDFGDFVIKELNETTHINRYSAAFMLEINEPIEFQKFYSDAKKNVERVVLLECVRRPIAYNHLRFEVSEKEYHSLGLLAQMPAVLHATFELKK